MSNGLIITRAVAVRAIQHRLPHEPIFGISKLILLGFEDVIWVEYLPRIEKWNLDFCDLEALIMFKIHYGG